MTNQLPWILLDFDGVIVDARAVLWDAYQQLAPRYHLTSYATPVLLGNATQRTVWKTLRHLGVPLIHMPGAFYRVMKLIRHGYHPALIPGMKSVLTLLAKRHRIAIVSTNEPHVILRSLKEQGVDTLVTEVIGGDFFRHKQRLFAYFLQAHTLHGSRVLFVTDTTSDVEEALRCGIPSIGVTWGFHTAEQLLTAGARQVVTKPRDLLQICSDFYERLTSTKVGIDAMSARSTPQKITRKNEKEHSKSVGDTHG